MELSLKLLLIAIICIRINYVISEESGETEEEYDFDELLMEPTPENVSLTMQLEEELEDDKKLECSTKDTDGDDIIASESIFSRTRISRRSKWKSFNVYIDPTYNKRDRTLINSALYRLHEVLKPCGIRVGIFRRWSIPIGDYIHVVNGNGCFSLIGRVGGRQLISLESPGCMNVATIIHEFMHSLGFHHEQNRPDRDEYVKIMWQNIPGVARSQFEKRSSKEVVTFGLDYDQNSIMHYAANAFSKNGQPTIVSKNGKPVGPTGKLTPTDIEKLKKMYCT